MRTGQSLFKVRAGLGIACEKISTNGPCRRKQTAYLLQNSPGGMEPEESAERGRIQQSKVQNSCNPQVRNPPPELGLLDPASRLLLLDTQSTVRDLIVNHLNFNCKVCFRGILQEPLKELIPLGSQFFTDT